MRLFPNFGGIFKKLQSTKSNHNYVFTFFSHLGRYLIMLRTAFSRPEKWRMYWIETARQMNDIGVGSVIIVALVSVFVGAVASVQFAYQLNGQLVPRYYIGYIVRDLCIIEMSPTVSCLVLAGKVGSNMAAEIGGMRQKEHIDAMEVMGVNTAAYLIMPKIIAALVMIPVLVALSAFLGIFTFPPIPFPFFFRLHLFAVSILFYQAHQYSKCLRRFRHCQFHRLLLLPTHFLYPIFCFRKFLFLHLLQMLLLHQF